MNFARELNRFDRRLPIESAPTPPSSWYLEHDFLQAETDRVLLRSWQPVARRAELQNTGDFVSGNFLGQPWVITLAGDGQLRAFYNVCRHHAAEVAEPRGCAEVLTCPYHGWTYDLDGRLRRAPRLGAVKEFQRDEYGLRPLQLATWGPWIWLNFSQPDQGTPLSEQLAELETRVPEASLAELHYVCTRSYEIECNWKVYVDNYLDGGYHVEVAHKALAGQLDLDGYQTQVLEPLVLQTCAASEGERLGDGAVYAWLYPNWMFNRYGDILDINWVIPLGPERCQTVFEYYFRNPEQSEFVEQSLAASHQVQLEDVAICESVQRGLRSRGYDVGRYAPSLEMGEYAFHHWLARDLT